MPPVGDALGRDIPRGSSRGFLRFQACLSGCALHSAISPLAWQFHVPLAGSVILFIYRDLCALAPCAAQARANRAMNTHLYIRNIYMPHHRNGPRPTEPSHYATYSMLKKGDVHFLQVVLCQQGAQCDRVDSNFTSLPIVGVHFGRVTDARCVCLRRIPGEGYRFTILI